MRLLFKFCVFCIYFATCWWGVSKAQEFTPVPFTSLGTEHHQISVLIDPLKPAARLQIGSDQIDLPDETLPLSALEIDTSLFFVLRRFHFDTLSFGVWDKANGFRQIRLAQPHSAWMFRAATLFQNKIALAFLDTTSKSNLVILGDINIPDVLLPETAAMLPNTDIDSKLLIAANDNAIYVTIERNSFVLKPQNAGLSWQRLSTITARKWLQLKTVGNDIFALGVPRFSTEAQGGQDSLFTVVNFSAAQIANSPAFPFHLQSSPQGLEMDSVRSHDDLSRLFTHEISTGENSGLLYLGCGQSEGRAAWAASYYLEGWIDILRDWPSTAADFNFLNSIKPQLKARLDLEMALLDRLLDDDRPGSYARRYTLTREPRNFAVHLGRLLQLFKRYRVECPNPIELRNFEALRNTTINLTGAVEEIVIAGPDDPSAPMGVSYLRLRKGEPCAFDGAPEPFNHQTAWAAGVLFHEPDSITSSAVGQTCRSIFNILLDYGSFRPPPIDHEWFYWWGIARTGWTSDQDISVNTPSYAGHKLNARIGYKTLDVQALFLARKLFPDLIEFNLETWACEGIQRGKLHPFVKESFAREGMVCPLGGWLALQQMRAGGAFEMKSAVWALESLAGSIWLSNPELNVSVQANGTYATITAHTKPAHEYELFAAASLDNEWEFVSKTRGDGFEKELLLPEFSGAESRFFKVLEYPVKDSVP